MKNKKLIHSLNASSDKVEFPGLNSPFHQYMERLQTVVYDNCGYDVSKTLEYDELEKCFFVTVSHGLPTYFVSIDRTEADKFNLNLDKVMRIDPLMPIGEQIEEIMQVKKHLRETLCLLMSLLEQQRTDRKR